MRSIPNTTAGTGFLLDAIIRIRLFRTKVVKPTILLLNNDYNNNRSNDYYSQVSDNTSDKTFRTTIILLRPLSKELNTTLHHPQHQLSNTYVCVSVNIRPGNKNHLE